MSSHQIFTWNGIAIKFFESEDALFIEPSPRATSDDTKLLKNKLETLLSVDSIKVEPNGISMKLAQGTSGNVKELLRSMGAEGGESVEDAASVAEKPAEEAVEEKQEDESLPPGMQGDPNQQMPAMEDPNAMAGGMMNASLYPKVYTLLYEGMFGSTKSFETGRKVSSVGRANKPGRRTGKYWKPLEQITGKNRAKIDKEDVLQKRRDYVKKPPSIDRDKVLRSLDKAFDYFYGKIEELKGATSAEKFAEDYHAVDNMNPGDYALKRKLSPISADEEPEVEFAEDEMNSPSMEDFADILSTDEDSYDDIEVDEETY